MASRRRKTGARKAIRTAKKEGFTPRLGGITKLGRRKKSHLGYSKFKGNTAWGKGK